MAAITPEAGIPTGMAAVRITAALPDDMGAVRSFEAPEDSQLRLADPADIPRVDMANPEEVPRPIVMTPGTNEVTVWLNTIHVTPGTYDIRFGSARGVCMAPLIVTSQG